MANMGEGGHNQPVIKDRWGIRKLTPKECARLQGYKDSWFTIPPGISKSQIYKQIGNSVTIPLVVKLAKRCVCKLEKADRENWAREPSDLLGYNMQWLFPRNDLGQDSGLHDAGVETFKGNYYRYLAREVLQNSLDARFDLTQPVVVKFECLEMGRDKIPDIDGLCNTLVCCREYWASDPKARAFFDKAVQLGQATSVTALRVSDYNTTGVVGNDTEHEELV